MQAHSEIYTDYLVALPAATGAGTGTTVTITAVAAAGGAMVAGGMATAGETFDLRKMRIGQELILPDSVICVIPGIQRAHTGG